MRLRILIALFVLLCLPAGLVAKKKGGATTLLKPDQVMQIENPKYVAAGDRCENWAWAAGLESMLASQDVPLDKKHWLYKIYGGELCYDYFGKFEDLAKRIDGEYLLDDGRRMQLKLEYFPGPPIVIDDIIVGLHEGHPVVLVWKGHPYLLYGVLYDEELASTGERSFAAKELRLLDPFEPSGEKHAVVLPRENAQEIDGIYRITATEILGSDWLRQRTK